MDFQLSLQSEETRSVYPESPLAVEPETSIADVIRLLQAEKTGAALVCDNERLVGIFTERDALRLMTSGADLSPPVTSVMSSAPVTIDSDAPVAEAIKRMSDGGYRHLAMVNADNRTKPTGLIDVRGIMRYLVEHFPNTIYNFPPNPQQAPAEREGA